MAGRNFHSGKYEKQSTVVLGHSMSALGEQKYSTIQSHYPHHVDRSGRIHVSTVSASVPTEQEFYFSAQKTVWTLLTRKNNLAPTENQTKFLDCPVGRVVTVPTVQSVE